MSSKKLVQYNPNTHAPTILATITLNGDKVTFEPNNAPEEHNMLKSLVGKGNKLIKPSDGKAYFDALDRLRGTYYEVLPVK